MKDKQIQTNTNKKYNNIDALRTFGCLAIVAWHVKANLQFNLTEGVAERVISSFDYLVYLFMIISGFGMCNGYYPKLKNGNYDLNKFYSRRYKKILPFFAILIILECVIDPKLNNIYEGLLEITMLFGFLPNNNLSVIGVAWTLGVIFVYYIIFPFIIFLLYNKRRGIITFFISLGITFMCQEYFMTEEFVANNFVMRHSFLFCLPYFLCGGLIYLYRNEIENIVNRHKLCCFIICVSLSAVYLLSPDKIIEFDIIVPKTLVLYTSWICLMLGEKDILFSNRFTGFISKISMEIYLAHMVVFRIVEKLHVPKMFGQTFLGYIFVYVVVVMLLITGISLYIKLQKHMEKIYRL